MRSTAEPDSCCICRYVATDTSLSIRLGRCNFRGGLEDGPIVELYKEPPPSCPLRAFTEDPC